MTAESFADPALLKQNYPGNDLHTTYIGEIVKVLGKKRLKLNSLKQKQPEVDFILNRWLFLLARKSTDDFLPVWYDVL